jgi:hypothetical protein
MRSVCIPDASEWQDGWAVVTRARIPLQRGWSSSRSTGPSTPTSPPYHPTSWAPPCEGTHRPGRHIHFHAALNILYRVLS